jgi:hypothetical protein
MCGVVHKTSNTFPSWRKLGQGLDVDYFLHFSNENVKTSEMTDLAML